MFHLLGLNRSQENPLDEVATNAPEPPIEVVADGDLTLLAALLPDSGNPPDPPVLKISIPGAWGTPLGILRRLGGFPPLRLPTRCFHAAGLLVYRVPIIRLSHAAIQQAYSFSPKFLTHRQDNSVIFNHQSGILGCVAWEHPDELEGPLLQRGRLGQSLDARRVRFRGQSALVAGPGPQVRHQRLQALQR